MLLSGCDVLEPIVQSAFSLLSLIRTLMLS